MKLTFWNIIIPIFLFNFFQANACDPIVITGTIVHENNCGSGPNGSIDIDISGGVPPYSFAWTSGDTIEDLSNIPAGSYGVTVLDSNGCPGVMGFVVNLVDSMTISDLSIYPSCDGDLGTGVVSVTGGNAPYEYLWSNGSLDSFANNLNVGIHKVVVTDASGCIDSLDIQIVTNPPLQVFPIVNHPVCYTDSGDVSLLILGGAQPYTIDWSGIDSANVAPGLYTVSVTDISGCEKEVDYTVLSEDEIVVDLDLTIESCDSNIYSVTAAVTGGVPPYSLNWSAADTTRVLEGNYSLTLIDAVGCEIVTPFEVDTAELFEVEVAFSTIGCLDTVTDATISIQGGVSPYQIEWSDGTLNIFTKTIIFSQSESVKIIDNRGCIIEKFFDVSGPSQIHLNPIITPATCGLNNGAIDFNASGGSGTYSYKVDGSSVSSMLSNLKAATYEVQVVDSKGCFLDTSIVIPRIPVAKLLGYTLEDNICDGDSIGAISVKFVDETLKLTWSTMDTTRFIDNLPGGSYKLTVQDTIGCTWDTTFVISRGGKISSSHSNTFNPCIDSEGELVSKPYGGIEPYTFLWEDGTEEDRIIINEIGIYSVTVTDSVGCSNEFQYQVIGDPVGGNVCFNIPNAFSPNNDGFNDKWEIIGIEAFPNSQVQIFDRWGKEVVNINKYKPSNFWDGTIEGNELEMGTYYYIVELNKPGVSVFKGSVSIKR